MPLGLRRVSLALLRCHASLLPPTGAPGLSQSGASPIPLPPAAADYVAFVEEALGVPVALVGTGQGREAVLTLG